MRASRFFVAATFVCSGCAAAGSTDAGAGKTYSGTYSATVVESTVSTSLTGGGTFPCTNTYTFSGTLTMTIDQANGAVNGAAHIAGNQTETSHSGGASCQAKGNLSTSWSPTLKGTTSDLTFSEQNVSTNGGYGVTSRTSFTGALSGGVVTGVLGFSVAGSGTIGSTSIVQSYSTSMNVTLR